VRYRARVEYDGTDFAGYQLQVGHRTVQGELEGALARLDGRGGGRVPVEAAGRTQVIAFSWPGAMAPDDLRRALEALLPRDIGIGPLRRVPAGFHPRYAARFRAYRYTIWNGSRSPLRERHALGVRDPLDDSAMAEAAQPLVGRHDFSAFGGWHRQPIRTLHRVRVRRTGRTITIDVVGDAFLRQMVRSIVAALLRVGRGEASGGEVAEALTGGTRLFAGAVAPPHGLCLRLVVLGRPQRTASDARSPAECRDPGASRAAAAEGELRRR
jgi:tRNA pseudouridine38-40 synthase